MGEKVVVVEDDSDVRDLLDAMLGAHGFEVAFAYDAVTAIATIRRHDPKVIVLDIGLPGGDGFVLMERLKTFPALANVPVVCVSATDPGTNRERMKEAGAVAYVEKPFTKHELLRAMNRALGTDTSSG
jgi:CheY-like chemotaxis protein